jgi:glycosyltransferase involved in cell wall biosynthesis
MSLDIDFIPQSIFAGFVIIKLKVIQVNKFFYLKGGSEAYIFSLVNGLIESGHAVADFAMRDANNRSSIWSKFFVEHIDYETNSLGKKLKFATKIIYSTEARTKIARILDTFEPDIAHLHIFQHQISPSIIPELKKRKLPIVYTAHDLKSVCPNYKMLTHDGICERCMGGKYYNCLIHKCTKNSRLKSFINVVEMYFHALMGWYDLIDIIVTPSDFYRRKLVDFHFPEHKVVHIPNFVDETVFEPIYSSRDYFLYFGRLSPEKGVTTLVEAMRDVPSFKLIIAGTGPAKEDIECIISQHRLTNVELVGFKSGTDLINLICGARFTVLPSEWYENGSIALLESMAYGKPVIGANVGGIPEHINHGEDGLTFESGNSEDLADMINTLAADRNKCISMGKAARRKIETVYSKRRHMDAILDIYQKNLVS